MTETCHHGIEHEIQQIYDLLRLEVTMMLLLSNLTTRKLLKYHVGVCVLLVQTWKHPLPQSLFPVIQGQTHQQTDTFLCLTYDKSNL